MATSGRRADIDWLRVKGSFLWASGDLIGLVLFGVLFVQWVRASAQEARREDRRLDRLERLAQSPDGPSPRAGSGDTPDSR
jgi:putative copper resistance protein D